MELPELGENCFVCNRNDYLPFKCAHCHKMVCVDHKTNHGPECPMNATTFDRPSNSSPQDSLKRACDFCNKITLKLELVECPHCLGLHCLYHRHQAQHKCKQLVESNQKRAHEDQARKLRQEEALARLRATARPDVGGGGPANQPASSLPQDPKKRELAKRIRVMKIKQSARGPPSISTQDRIYFEIRFVHNPQAELSDPLKENKTIKLFTTRQHTLGRLIDWAADELSLKNKNYLAAAPNQLIFMKQSVALDSQQTFGNLLESNTLEEGDEISLTYTN